MKFWQFQFPTATKFLPLLNFSANDKQVAVKDQIFRDFKMFFSSQASENGNRAGKRSTGGLGACHPPPPAVWSTKPAPFKCLQ